MPKPANKYMLNVNKRNTTTVCETCSRLKNIDTKKMSMPSLWCLFCQL